MEGASRALVATATGALDPSAREGALLSVQLCAGADAATATFRDGGSGGTIIAKLGAGVGLSASHTFNNGVPYKDLHLTVTGTTPVCMAEVL